MAECLTSLANENGLHIENQLAEQLVLDDKTRRSAAYLTYGHSLILRLSGKSDGPAILALWRLIAWDSRGGMLRGFTLTVEDFSAAEKTLLDAIRNASKK